jgi:hypothetical protein
MGQQIILAKYDVDDDKDGNPINKKIPPSKVYDKGKNLLRVRTEHGKMWVSLIKFGGSTNADFNPCEDRILVFLPEGDYTISNTMDSPPTTGKKGKDKSTIKVAGDTAFAVIIKLPPQFVKEFVEKKKNVKPNIPTKTIDGTANESEYGTEINDGNGNGIKVDEETGVTIKSKGAQTRYGDQGRIDQGRVTTLNFFNESVGGVMKQNWLPHILPESIKVAIEVGTGTALPSYLPDSGIVDMVKNIGDAVKDFKTMRV